MNNYAFRVCVLDLAVSTVQHSDGRALTIGGPAYKHAIILFATTSELSRPRA